MEASPLTQQARPEVFQQKVVELYEALFKHEDGDDAPKSEGFWRELFLLKPHRPTLQSILDDLPPDHLLMLQAQTRQLFLRATQCVKDAQPPTDAHALDTLAAFLAAVLPKKYTNPSSDIIGVLTGLDEVDSIFSDFVAALDQTIRTGRSLSVRQKAINVALTLASGAYTTSLLSYFTHRDLFPSLVKFIQDTETTSQVYQPFTLLGVLANYNRFEIQNPYRLRLDDFVNEAIIQKIVRAIGQACAASRRDYVAVQEDLPEGWSLVSALGMVGLGSLTPGGKAAPPKVDPEVAKERFSKLPTCEAAVLLATYDFIQANKLFCFNFVSLAGDAGCEAPISSFLSNTSYLLQHAHTSTRAAHYSRLNLNILRLLIEDPVLCKRMCSRESTMAVRLCRQRQPYLPLVAAERTLAASILDTMTDGITHNLRRRLDVSLYILNIQVMLRIISHLARSRTRLTYHWSELFRALLTLVRFLTSYVADVKSLAHMDELVDTLVTVVALSLSAGEAFLPSPAAYDDLFYKVVETGAVLAQFRDGYGLDRRRGHAIEILVGVSRHYDELLKAGNTGSTGRAGKALTSAQVAGVIKQGYDTLSLQAGEGLEAWTAYREADERGFLKKMARVAVVDCREVVQVCEGASG